MREVPRKAEVYYYNKKMGIRKAEGERRGTSFPWKMTDTYRDWHERVHSNFWGIEIRTYTGNTPWVMGFHCLVCKNRNET